LELNIYTSVVTRAHRGLGLHFAQSPSNPPPTPP
jgi:hypothetical protein